MLHLLRHSRPILGRSATRAAALTLALSGLAAALPAAPASASAPTSTPTPADIAARFDGDVNPADIEHIDVAPNGANVLFRRLERITPDSDSATSTSGHGSTAEARVCSDVWVAGAASGEPKRLSGTCESNPAYGPFTAEEQWSPDGAATYFSGMNGSHATGMSSRWTLGASAPGGAVRWTEETYRGAGAGYTADGRFWLLRIQGWGYLTTEWAAVELRNGAVQPIWDELRSGEGHWSTACAPAAAPAQAPAAPSVTEVLGVLSGPAPACAFATPTRPATATPAPTATSASTVDVPRPRPNGPAGAGQTGLVEMVAAPTVSSVRAASGSAGLVENPKLRIRAVTSHLGNALDRGLGVKFEAPGAVSAKAWLVLTAATKPGIARTSLASGSTIARGSAKRVGIGVTTLTLRLDPAARKALRGSSGVRAFVRVRTVDAAGSPTVVERAVALGR